MLSTLLLFVLAVAVHVAHATTIKYVFDPATAAGIRGWIQVCYWDHSDNDTDHAIASLHWNVDFSGVDPYALLKADGNCTTAPTMYMWHIHVKWPNSQTSASFQDCSLARVGNHYDPLHACGPNSEFAGKPECLNKPPSQYMCSPATYAVNTGACEKGDLSGKLGAFMPNYANISRGHAIDWFYPTLKESTPQWNVVVHAMCGKATPRVACAVGQTVEYDDSPNQHEDDDAHEKWWQQWHADHENDTHKDVDEHWNKSCYYVDAGDYDSHDQDQDEGDHGEHPGDHQHQAYGKPDCHTWNKDRGSDTEDHYPYGQHDHGSSQHDQGSHAY